METKDKKSNGLLAMAAQTPPAPQTAQAAPAAPAAPAATPAGLFGTGLRQSGFRNVFENGKATGFQVAVVNSYYRGTYASLTEYFDVTVDGEKFPRESITCTFDGTTITIPSEPIPKCILHKRLIACLVSSKSIFEFSMTMYSLPSPCILTKLFLSIID